MTTNRVFLRRGTRTDNDSYIGAIGELTYNTTDSTIRVYDGQNAGGSEVLVNGRSLTTTFNGTVKASAFQFSNGVNIGARVRNLFVILYSGSTRLCPSESSFNVQPRAGANVSISVPSTQNYITFTKRNNVTTYIPIF